MVREVGALFSGPIGLFNDFGGKIKVFGIVYASVNVERFPASAKVARGFLNGSIPIRRHETG